MMSRGDYETVYERILGNRVMQRSRSYTALNKIKTFIEDEEEEEARSIRCKESITTDELDKETEYSIIAWYGNKKKIALVNFSPACLFLGAPAGAAETIKKYHMTYKFVNNECKLVKGILQSHGFRESHPFSSYFNIHWSGCHVKPYTYRALTEFQKVNHFPRSYELTRKDRLFKNVQKMQHAKGVRHFDFVPSSFVLPSEMADFQSAFLRERGFWIVKPVASSRGRGIYLISDPSQICLDDRCLVSKYIDGPLLVDGYKFDLRIYVVVTSFDPLRIYMFEEGLARFSTVKYDKKASHLNNHWMHLTNYSVNKTNSEYVRCEDPEVDDFGNKWSLSAMLRYLKDDGRDTEILMGKIEEVVVKAILSAEMPIASGCRMFVPSRWNCFELFGFDILIDENMKPWLLEINLSPSLACDAPMDLKIKSSLVSDLFNVTGVIAHDPIVKCGRRGKSVDLKKVRSLSAHPSDGNLVAKVITQAKAGLGLNNEEAGLLRETKEEYKRRGGLVRIFPTPESWDMYGNLHEQFSSKNKMIHARLFPDLWRNTSQRPSSASNTAPSRSTENLIYCRSKFMKSSINGLCQHDRYLIFERKLETVSSFDVLEPHDTMEHVVSEEKEGVKVPYKVHLHNSVTQRDHITENRRKSLTIKDMIARGETMSSLQARESFAKYLQRVRHRLLQELSAHRQNGRKEDCNDEKEGEQLDLIMRFLKRASANLSKPLDVNFSTNPVTMNEVFVGQSRRGALAKKLGEFIEIYSKDTQMLLAKGELDDTSDLGSFSDCDDGTIPESDFKKFLAAGSEHELEELLTAFTKQNNSSVIFQGSKRDFEEQKAPVKSTNPSNIILTDGKETKIQARDQSRKNGHNSWKDVLESSQKDNFPLHSDKYTRSMTTAKVYSSSVALRQASRATSAISRVNHSKMHNEKRTRTYSITSIQSRGSHDVSSGGNAVTLPNSATNETDHDTMLVGTALQRLLIKQSERNYCAPKTKYYISSVQSADDSAMNKYSGTLAYSHNVRSTDAESTFKAFVDFQNSIAKNENDVAVRANSLEHSIGTQTIETCVSRLLNKGDEKEPKTDNSSTERKTNGEKGTISVSRAQYNAHLKSLHEGIDMQPHPPSSKPPVIRKPIRTQRIIKFASGSTRDWP